MQGACLVQRPCRLQALWGLQEAFPHGGLVVQEAFALSSVVM